MKLAFEIGGTNSSWRYDVVSLLGKTHNRKNRLNGFHNQYLLVESSGDQKSKIHVSAGLVHPETTLLGFLSIAFSVSSHAVSSSNVRRTWALMSCSFYKDTRATRLGLLSNGSFNNHYLLMGPFSNYSHTGCYHFNTQFGVGGIINLITDGYY